MSCPAFVDMKKGSRAFVWVSASKVMPKSQAHLRGRIAIFTAARVQVAGTVVPICRWRMRAFEIHLLDGKPSRDINYMELCWLVTEGCLGTHRYAMGLSGQRYPFRDLSALISLSSFSTACSSGMLRSTHICLR